MDLVLETLMNIPSTCILFSGICQIFVVVSFKKNILKYIFHHRNKTKIKNQIEFSFKIKKELSLLDIMPYFHYRYMI